MPAFYALHKMFVSFKRLFDAWLGSVGAPQPQVPPALAPQPYGRPPLKSDFSDYGFSPVTWIMEALARPRLELERELELVERLSKWKKSRYPCPWRAWSRAEPHHRKRRFVEYSPGIFRRIA